MKAQARTFLESRSTFEKMDRAAPLSRWTLEVPVGVYPALNQKVSTMLASSSRSQSSSSLPETIEPTSIPTSARRLRRTKSITLSPSPSRSISERSIRKRQPIACSPLDRINKILDICEFPNITASPSPLRSTNKSQSPTQRSRSPSPSPSPSKSTSSSTKYIRRRHNVPEFSPVQPNRNGFNVHNLKQITDLRSLYFSPEELEALDSPDEETTVPDEHNLQFSMQNECGRRSLKTLAKNKDAAVKCNHRKKSVTFSTVRRVKKVTHINDLKKMTDLSRLWFSPEELNAIDSNSRETIDRIKKGVQLNEEHECVRGLEKLFQTEQVKRDSRRSNAITVVLEEQKTQKKWGIQDEEYLADLYQEFTHDSQDSATIAGLQDSTQSFNFE